MKDGAFPKGKIRKLFGMLWETIEIKNLFEFLKHHFYFEKVPRFF